MNLGHIDYLNCYPFYFHMFEKESLKGVRIFSDYPSMLNMMMAKGQLDMSPISSAACADIADDVLILPQFCLSSIGYVGSVILVSKVPIEDLNHKKVGITSASHTSVVLLKVLLKKYYRQEPIFIPTEPRPDLTDIDAALIIGNDAMVKISVPAQYVYDLGDLWLRKTGFPVVFAVFAVRENIVSKFESEIQAVISSYHTSLGYLEREKDSVIRKAKARYPDILYDIDHYYDLLEFQFTGNLKDALMSYYAAAGELGLLHNVERLRYMDI
jgi:chorismate dehydratase